MTPKPIPRDSLVQHCVKAMRAYEMSEPCLERYRFYYRDLLKFMQDHNIQNYTDDVGEAYCEFIKETKAVMVSTKQDYFRAIKLLRMISRNLPYNSKFYYRRSMYEFQGNVGKVAEKYIQKQEEIRQNPVTINQKKRILGAFSIAMTEKKITVKTLKEDDLVDYISCIQTSRAITISILKGFMAYLYENSFTTINLTNALTNIKPAFKQKIISYYSQEEVAQIENSVDRRTVMGKRNYAMILLASRLGLRASDIIGLTFDNIDWDKNLITLRQYKTKRLITLPLLADVGSAIIDYILYARPKTIGLNTVFVSGVMPFRPCTTTSFSSVVQNTIRKSGVSFDGRHKGAHCLRHSLATSLLNEGTDFPVISEVLGHESSTSTMIYLGVNVKELLGCSLDVPEVSDSFYNQKGGIFYD